MTVGDTPKGLSQSQGAIHAEFLAFEPRTPRFSLTALLKPAVLDLYPAGIGRNLQMDWELTDNLHLPATSNPAFGCPHELLLGPTSTSQGNRSLVNTICALSMHMLHPYTACTSQACIICRTTYSWWHWQSQHFPLLLLWSTETTHILGALHTKCQVHTGVTQRMGYCHAVAA